MSGVASSKSPASWDSLYHAVPLDMTSKSILESQKVLCSWVLMESFHCSFHWESWIVAHEACRSILVGIMQAAVNTVNTRMIKSAEIFFFKVLPSL